MMDAWYTKNSGAFSGNLGARIPALRQNRSEHWEISWIGGDAGGVFPGVWGRKSSSVTSHISTNSNLSIRVTTFCGRDAAGFYGVCVRLVPADVAGTGGVVETGATGAW